MSGLLALILSIWGLPLHSQEFNGKDASAWCQAALREKIPKTLVSGSLCGQKFLLKAASCSNAGISKMYMLSLKSGTGSAPRVYVHLLETEIEGKTIAFPQQKKAADGIYYSEAGMSGPDYDIPLGANECCGRIMFAKKRPDGLIPGYIAFRAEPRMPKWKAKYPQSSLSGFFYASTKAD
jgi:hypothetical protein